MAKNPIGNGDVDPFDRKFGRATQLIIPQKRRIPNHDLSLIQEPAHSRRIRRKFEFFAAMFLDDIPRQYKPTIVPSASGKMDTVNLKLS